MIVFVSTIVAMISERTLSPVEASVLSSKATSPTTVSEGRMVTVSRIIFSVALLLPPPEEEEWNLS